MYNIIEDKSAPSGQQRLLLSYRTFFDWGPRYLQSPPWPDVFAISPRSSQHPDVDQVRFRVRERHIRRALRRMRDTYAQGFVHHPVLGIQDPRSKNKFRGRMADMLGNVTKNVKWQRSQGHYHIENGGDPHVC